MYRETGMGLNGIDLLYSCQVSLISGILTIPKRMNESHRISEV